MLRACGAFLAAAAALVVAATLDPALASAGTLLPERGGSPNADRIASLYAVVLVLAALVFVGVTVALVYALARYRERRGSVPAQIRGHTRLEIAWTVAATLLIVAIAALSLVELDAIENPPPADATRAEAVAAGGEPIRIRVIGRQYVWEFHYPNGAYSYEELVAPVGVTVELDIESVDVAHSWWIPKLGGKFDAVPGYVNHTWFRLSQPGVYRGQCAELCGRNHADMSARVRGLPAAEYAAWVERKRAEIGAANDAAAEDRTRIEREREAGDGAR